MRQMAITYCLLESPKKEHVELSIWICPQPERWTIGVRRRLWLQTYIIQAKLLCDVQNIVHIHEVDTFWNDFVIFDAKKVNVCNIHYQYSIYIVCYRFGWAHSHIQAKAWWPFDRETHYHSAQAFFELRNDLSIWVIYQNAEIRSWFPGSTVHRKFELLEMHWRRSPHIVAIYGWGHRSSHSSAYHQLFVTSGDKTWTLNSLWLIAPYHIWWATVYFFLSCWAVNFRRINQAESPRGDMLRK